jgi:Uma2 family endonuclease
MSVFGSNPPAPVRPSVVPPLEPGDRLTRDEFERRYDATPGLKKAELIEGVVYMPPPVSHAGHSIPQALLTTWLVTYSASTPGVEAGDNGSVRLDPSNMPQPDVYLLIRPECGGQSLIDDDDYVAGAPELVGEVASSTASRDLHDKLQAYQRNGVREYVVWRTRDGEVDVFALREGRYKRISPDTDGISRSVAFPGLWLATAALIAGDAAEVLRVVQQGTQSPEHAEFVRALAARRKT